MSGNPHSRDVSAVRVLAAHESRHEERTASLSHLITRDDMTVVFTSANRRLMEFAPAAAPGKDAAMGVDIHNQAHSRAACAGPLFEGGPRAAAA